MMQILRTDWEQEVDVIDKIGNLCSGEPMASVRMRDGRQCRLSTEWLALHCPRKSLRFHEGESKLKVSTIPRHMSQEQKKDSTPELSYSIV